MITDMLQKHLKNEKASFHMPGHKSGRGFLGTPFSSGLFALDTTELSDTDALIAPSGAILEAEQRAAAYYGAKHSFYLVNGATGGNLAMIYAAFSPGDTVLLDRNCHSSVLNAATLSGIKPIYLTPEMSPLPDLPGTVTPEGVTEALRQYPQIRGAVITSPNYYGKSADIQKIAETLHDHGALLLVDEAHGAHFPFAKEFPLSAMAQG
ncbi:MAG: aminotransferase class I/II-fold pyridoxal phosphate-dependent enzyme, partial [Clostridia bacterium]|nr:aminotransferase class I/II-fold pyridoxal phosphate-dependent enzyme [Clostridia bacterium]